MLPNAWHSVLGHLHCDFQMLPEWEVEEQRVDCGFGFLIDC